MGVILILQERLQVNFVIDDKFKLDDLLKLELHKFEEEVGEIVDRAQKEEKMEQSLAKLKVTLPLSPPPPPPPRGTHYSRAHHDGSQNALTQQTSHESSRSMLPWILSCIYSLVAADS